MSISLKKYAESIARETTNKHSTEHLDRNSSMHNMYWAQYQLKFYQLGVKVELGVNQMVARTLSNNSGYYQLSMCTYRLLAKTSIITIMDNWFSINKYVDMII